MSTDPETTRPANDSPIPKRIAPVGSHISAQIIPVTTTKLSASGRTKTTRSATGAPLPNGETPVGSTSSRSNKIRATPIEDPSTGSDLPLRAERQPAPSELTLVEEQAAQPIASNYPEHTSPARSAEQTTPVRTKRQPVTSKLASGQDQPLVPGTIGPPVPNHSAYPAPSGLIDLINGAVEADPAFLALIADTLNDLESARIAGENRYRHLTRDVADLDGQVRGLGLDVRNPHVRRIAGILDQLAAAEHSAVLALEHAMRKHPLGPWGKAQIGIGKKQLARLLASIGDPYVRPTMTRPDGVIEPSRPRLVSELWAYCGLHVTHFPADHQVPDAHVTCVGGDKTGHPDQTSIDTHRRGVGVAPRRQKGQRANWNADAKSRVYLIAESCIKQRHSPYRAVYDQARIRYADDLHQTSCARCGPSGKPAKIGSPLSAGHQHARAMRKVSKEILKDLWRESQRLHQLNLLDDQTTHGTQPSTVVES